jgi:hypothetical protein
MCSGGYLQTAQRVSHTRSTITAHQPPQRQQHQHVHVNTRILCFNLACQQRGGGPFNTGSGAIRRVGPKNEQGWDRVWQHELGLTASASRSSGTRAECQPSISCGEFVRSAQGQQGALVNGFSRRVHLNHGKQKHVPD